MAHRPWTDKEYRDFLRTLKKHSDIGSALRDHERRHGTGRTRDSILQKLAREGDCGYAQYLRPPKPKAAISAAKMPDSVRMLVTLLKDRSGMNVADVCNHLDISPRRLDDLVEAARALHHKINVPAGGEALCLERSAPPPDRRSVFRLPIEPVKDLITFVAASDPHYGSLHARPECVQDAIRYAYEEHGARHVFWSGDMTDGLTVYKGQATELRDHTFEAQLRAAVRSLPRFPGLMHHAIGGNHDENFLKENGTDVMEHIADKRDDFKVHGYYLARADIGPSERPDALKIELYHPGGGIPYARSYRLQQAINKIPGGMKPHILLAGHLHVEMTMWYRGIFGVQVPCFQDQTLLGKRMGEEPEIGCFIFKVGLTKGCAIKTITTTRVRYFHSARGPVRCDVVERDGEKGEKRFERRDQVG